MKLKKVFATALVASMVLALAACTKTTETEVNVDDSQIAVVTSEIGEVIDDTTGDEGYIEDEFVDDKAFIGTWVCGRASMEITPDSNGYAVHIIWGNTAAEASEWDYFCLFDGQKLMNHGDGIYKVVTYDEEGNGTEEVVYEDGPVTFEFDENNIVWNDEKENAGDGMLFEKVEIVEAE